jgi:hypothetical protein
MIGIFAGVPCMGIIGFIPGPVIIAHAVTDKKYSQKRMEIQRTGLPNVDFCDNRGNRSKSGIREPASDSSVFHVHGLPVLKHRKFWMIQILPQILQHRAGCIYLPSL